MEPMAPKSAAPPPTVPDLPGDLQSPPHATLRSPPTGYLLYDIDPNQIPTETIAQGGRRLVVDAADGPAEPSPEDRTHYEVIDKISEGGAGIVFSVVDKTLRREVALKICRAGITTDPATTQVAGEFTNEAYMTARLDHPGVVPIYALAKDADGRPFFAMKKVIGTNWRELLHPETIADPARRAELAARAAHATWKDHLHILLKVCDAVAYAHSKFILHRDLKPENIMLGDFGEVYVMDWGLALYFDERNEYRRFPQLRPQLAGTPCYIAPEMVRGELAGLGPASDVYLLGGILYEILTGRPPHGDGTILDILKQVAAGHVPPFEAIERSTVSPPAFAHVVRKALAPRAADRYPTVLAFQQDLRDVLAHSESMSVDRRAAELLADLRRDLLANADAAPPLKTLAKEAAAGAYGRLSECIGGFRQALGLWEGNADARRGLVDAVVLQIRLAVCQDDLLLARAQLRVLEELATARDDSPPAAEARAQARELAGRIECRQGELDRAARRVRGWKIAAGGLFLLALAGFAGIAVLSVRQRALAVRNEQDMFAASVAGRAQMLEQFMVGIEQIAALYRQTAVELMTAPADRLPHRDPTPAGRDGFYTDDDFAAPATRPPRLETLPRYPVPLSLEYPTVVHSPWARQEANRAAADRAAARLSRLGSLFGHFHRMRDDLQWSLAGSETGLLVGFPGFSRYGDKPDYDATKRTWYRAAIDAADDRPVWGHPYADASTRMILMSCMCRIHADGQNVGVVGVEITMASLQRMLVDFSSVLGGKRRALLIRPFAETDPQTGEPRTVYRAVVDTHYRESAADWQTQLEMVDVEQADPEISAYVRGIRSGLHAPGRCLEIGSRWLAHAPLPGRDWILVAILDREAAPAPKGSAAGK